MWEKAFTERFISSVTDKVGDAMLRLCWHLSVRFFFVCLDQRLTWRLNAVRGLNCQLYLPLLGEDDLFNILLQASEPRRCHGMRKVKCITKGDSDKASEPTSNESPKNSPSLCAAPQRRLFSGGNTHKAGGIKRIKAAQ